ncbi:hypothetical protein JCM33374_g343 [Metschnikowia sp. JCM 33374]|nr:hypothetical protein JCM33374_g343 [Metschnikowia sp. JCM 33374]
MIISKRSHLNKVEKEKHLLPLIDDLCASDHDQLAKKLLANLNWNLPQGNLLHWVRVLNLFDDIFEKQVAKYDLASEHPKLRDVCAEDSELLIACLKFTKMLLDHCTNRSIYASSERIFSLVNTPSIDVKLAALEVALCLGERYVYGSQHKKFVAPKPARLRFLETAKAYPPMVPASFIQSRQESGDKSSKDSSARPKNDHYSWVDTLDHNQKYPSKWKTLHFEYYRSKAVSEKEKKPKKEKKKYLVPAALSEEGLASFHLSEDQVRKLSLEQIFDRASENLPDYTWFSFSFFALNAKAFNSKSHDSMELRAKLLRMKCLAIACVACFCSSDFTSCQLFEIEPYTLGFLTDLVSPEYSNIVSSEIFYTASKTIRAISMKRVWGSEIVRHLGGNVNHGLLYEVLRHINKQVRSNKPNTHQEGHKVFLTILGDLVESKTLAPRLVAGGLLTELMAFMDIRGENTWCASAAVHIIAGLLASSPEFVGDFADNNGFSLLINTINYEVDFALENPGFAGGAPQNVPVYHTISLKQVKYLRNLLDFVSNLISSDAGDRLRNLFDSPILASFTKIIMNPNVFGPSILATTLDDVAQIIHNEPTAFSILNEAGVVSSILNNYANLFMPLGELLLSLLEVLGAISLNKKGMNKVIESGVIHTFFLSFYDLELAKESMRSDMCSNIGCSMDELGRHNPPLRPLIMKEIKILVSKFPEHANKQLTPIRFYSSNLGHMYKHPTEKVILKEDDQDEIETWEGMFSSNLVDCVFGFLNGLLQDTGQWGKDVIKEVPFSSWESFFTMPNTPFDFTVSNGVLNLIAVLKYLDDEVESYGLVQILESISERLNSSRMKAFIENNEKKSYFIDLGKQPHEATALLMELNSLNSLFFVLTEIYLNPSSISNETYQGFIDYLHNNDDLILRLVKFMQVVVLEETNIRSALPDDVMEKTCPSIFYTIKTTAIQILPRQPPTENQYEEYSSAKYKNTLQLRFLMDMLVNNLAVTFSCISRSCMHRRQDFFTDAWRRSSVVATRSLSLGLQDVLEKARGLSKENYLEYYLRIVHVISFVSTYKDRGKEVLSTAFVSFFFCSTNIGKILVEYIVSAFNDLCALPETDLKTAQDLTFIQNTTASIGLNFLNLSLSFIIKFLTPGQLNKFPFTTYFLNKEYCANELVFVDCIRSQAAAQCLILVSRVLGTESKFGQSNDYSRISAFPFKVSESLVNIARLTWSVNPMPEYYVLREDWMTPALAEVKYLAKFLDIDIDVAHQLLSYAKSLKNIVTISEKASKMNLPNWESWKEKFQKIDFDPSREYNPRNTDAADILNGGRKKEEDQIFSVAFIQLTAFKSGIHRLVNLAFQTNGIHSEAVNNVYNLIEKGVWQGRRC